MLCSHRHSLILVPLLLCRTFLRSNKTALRFGKTISKRKSSTMAAVGVARRAEEGTLHTIKDSGPVRLGQKLHVSKDDTGFVTERIALFEKLYAEQQERVKDRAAAGTAIDIVLPDGTKKSGISFSTTPMDVAVSISKGLAGQALIAKLYPIGEVSTNADIVAADEDEDDCQEVSCTSCHGQEALLWDMQRPLEFSCKMEFLKFDSAEAQHVFWHSSAHILGAAFERAFGAHLTIGPALERGFYYDAYLGEELKISQDHYGALEEAAQSLMKENAEFQRLVIDKATALELFKANPFKSQLIETKVPDGALTTVYRCGTFVDLCRGPHLPTTGKVKAFSIEKHSAVYWLGKSNNDSLQRVYGVSFPDAKLMKQYKTMVEEAKKRDHRVVGGMMNLFFFDSTLTPGSCFWLPNGTKVYNKLVAFIRNEYRFRGFTEVISPNIFSCETFKVSGHYQNYKENMYCFDVEGKEWALKPMNCPGHCLMFRHMNPSYRQLPLRMADFGVLHRNELSGSLTGLTRVRRFQQDDAHIFCRFDQIQQEVFSALEFLFFVYGVFNFEFEMKLSTRPKKALGAKSLWDEAEAALAKAMDATGRQWSVNPGDGAFYGPKIDIRLRDALQRWHQCGTVQLDFQLPLRFNLSYRTEEVATAAAPSSVPISAPKATAGVDMAVTSPEERAAPQAVPAEKTREDGSWEAPLKSGFARPVMVHRAILGSIERMSAVLLEHTGGKYPFWLSPRQAIVCPISEKNADYADYVAKLFIQRGYDVAVDTSNTTINKKIRQAQLERWNYALVVGQKEQETSTVMLRDRDDPDHQKQLTLPEVLELFKSLRMPCSAEIAQIAPYAPKATATTQSEQVS